MTPCPTSRPHRYTPNSAERVALNPMPAHWHTAPLGDLDIPMMPMRRNRMTTALIGLLAVMASLLMGFSFYASAERRIKDCGIAGAFALAFLVAVVVVAAVRS